MLNMDASGHNRRRVLFHLLLGIGLPSVLLGYLAFRGIRNDMALLERARIQEHAAVARQITESIDREISALEGLLLDAIPGRQASGGEVRPLESLQRLKSQEPLIEEVFSFERGEQIEFPLGRTCRSRQSPRSGWLRTEPATAYPQTGQRLFLPVRNTLRGGTPSIHGQFLRKEAGPGNSLMHRRRSPVSIHAGHQMESRLRFFAPRPLVGPRRAR